jgi:hypothetical protein
MNIIKGSITMNEPNRSLKLSRRTVLATASAAGVARFLPKLVTTTGGRRILTVYFDKAAGAMRAVEKFIP